jgi:hypothetical protein
MNLTEHKIAKLFFRLKRRFVSVGQISQHNEVGRWIQLLSSLDDVKSIVEIGTWNGKGSSKCIALGVLQRATPNCRVIGFEVNPDMFKKAKRNLSKFDFFEVLFGSVVGEQELDQTQLNEQEMGWFVQDLKWIRESPSVLDRVPKEIDLLILDGGEFSTYAEFKKLEKKLTRWLILDDTRTRKCSKILEELLHNPQYLIVHVSQERNGTAVLMKLA